MTLNLSLPGSAELGSAAQGSELQDVTCPLAVMAPALRSASE